MTEPTTVNKSLIVPLTGDLPGAWGTSAMNPNFLALDGMLGGVTTISVSAATTVALTAPSGSITPGAGPTQQQNALIRFTGTLNAIATYQFSVPGFYIIDNQLTMSTVTAALVLGPATGTGTSIGIAPGKKTQVFFDGTNMDWVNAPDPGTAIDFHCHQGFVGNSGPEWMYAGTKNWALLKDGSIYSVSVYPALAAMVGSTYGGDGVTTFGVPDEFNRMRIPVDTGRNGGFRNRVTSGGSGVNGQNLGATGGDERMQSHSHGSPSLNDPGHSHSVNFQTNIVAAATPAVEGSNGPSTGSASGAINSNTTGITLGATTGSSGGGGSQNMPPTIVSFLALIKT